MQSIENAVKLAKWAEIPQGNTDYSWDTDPASDFYVWDDDLPAYFSTWEGTGRLIEKMREGRAVTLMCYPKGDESGWWCSVDSPFSSRHQFQAQREPTGPEAVQQAALKIIEEAKADGQD